MVTAARYAPSNGWSIAVGSVPFVEFVTAHRHGHATVPPDLDGRDWRRTLALRATDTAVHQQTDLMMLSVAADRIAHPAMPCAALLARLARDERVAARRQPDDTARTAGGSSGGRARRSPAWPSARRDSPHPVTGSRSAPGVPSTGGCRHSSVRSWNTPRAWWRLRAMLELSRLADPQCCDVEASGLAAGRACCLGRPLDPGHRDCAHCSYG